MNSNVTKPHGSGHWLLQRVSAIVIAVFGLWFVFSIGLLIKQQGYKYMSVIDWLHQPWNAFLAIVLSIAALYHSSLGFQVVIEDYVHHSFKRRLLLNVQKAGHLVLAVAAVISIVQIGMGG